MRIGLSMIVKDEASQIGPCLEQIYDLFDDIAIVDTGSTDETVEILRLQFGITPVVMEQDSDFLFIEDDARNAGLMRVSGPWVLVLDADERISRQSLEKIIAMPDDPQIAGYFCAWNTRKPDGSIFEDYKLSIFRKGIKKTGLVHPTTQFDVRARQLRANWLEGIEIEHYPDNRKMKMKIARRKDTLLGAIKTDPLWYRFHWFLGYLYFREESLDEAVKYLSVASESHSKVFPVECLNSKMILAQIYALRGQRRELEDQLTGALRFYDLVAEDFEVQVNFRLRPWLEQALQYCRDGRLKSICAYEFSY